MAKKKRSAKQLANDKRLGRMAKARAKKRGKKKARKKTRRKVTRKKNVIRKGLPKRIAKKKRTRSAKSHLWMVFKCTGKMVSYLLIGPDLGIRWSTDKSKALLVKTKRWAANIAETASKKRGMSNYYIGVAPDSMTSSQIVAQCKGKV